jgi:hypothetical protein
VRHIKLEHLSQYIHNSHTVFFKRHLLYTYPFLAPWKKNLTINTCNPAMTIIIRPSKILKLKMRPSVLRTVEKFRFSRVRKYF